ncbi:hypothetical protein G9C85_07190 [Halorubellus sp. JP-L1]|uniref:hypothetical protein n=1 Tax=Halorubellus sp. JP-L1 TaxID=2715753 RepID=UPI001408089D|nr:hypothetical protein [Halorubellus sp. JP-L1]NHN41421.1 hypothetical protein [Halorubellus sp. JP-L1]
MSDGSREETVEKSTDELLSETEDVLSEIDDGGGSASRSGDASAGGDVEDSAGGLDDAMSDLDADAGTGHGQSAGDAPAGSESVADDRGFRKYFDPSSAAISGIVLSVGALLGFLVPIPVVGSLARLLGVGVGAFLHGATASDSRYAETVVASGVVGLVFTLLTTSMFVALSDVGVPILAISTAVTVAVALVGHYFGRDLRAGLTADVGGSGGSQEDDAPGW